MKVCGTIPVSELARSSDLAGAADGAAWLQMARPHVDAAPPGLYAVDFSGVRIATVSWLREAILALLKYANAVQPELRFVATGLSEIVREEFEVALQSTGGVLIAADIGPDRDLTAPTVLGQLDPALHDTLLAVEGQIEFDATFVSRVLPSVGLSAANNRLAALETKGILVSERRGRSRHYRHLLENLRYGHRNDRQSDGQLRAQAAEMPGTS